MYLYCVAHTIGGTYTLSRTYDNHNGNRGGTPTNWFNLDDEYTYAGSDQRNRVVVNAVATKNAMCTSHCREVGLAKCFGGAISGATEWVSMDSDIKLGTGKVRTESSGSTYL